MKTKKQKRNNLAVWMIALLLTMWMVCDMAKDMGILISIINFIIFGAVPATGVIMNIIDD